METEPSNDHAGRGAANTDDRLERAYEPITAFFDRFAGEEPYWRGRNPTYHQLVERPTGEAAGRTRTKSPSAEKSLQ